MSDLRVSFPKPCAEPWDAMRPEGCNRHCAACDKVIHDLSAMTIEDFEELVRIDPKPCVRARISAHDIVELKTSEGNTRRIAAVMGASIGLMVAACQTVAPTGSIAGRVDFGEELHRPTVRARDADGRIYRAEVQPDGTYEIANLPTGTYSLTFSELYCSSHLQKVDNVEVKATKVEAVKVDWSRGCDDIIIGLIEIDDHQT